MKEKSIEQVVKSLCNMVKFVSLNYSYTPLQIYKNVITRRNLFAKGYYFLIFCTTENVFLIDCYPG